MSFEWDDKPLLLEPPMQHMALPPIEQPPYSTSVVPIVQPPGSTSVVVVNQQPSVENRLVLGNIRGHREWTSGLCDCMDDGGGCLKTCCCMSCTLMELSAKLNENVCVVNCVPGSLVALRARLRTLGGIKGSICKDYCALLWCHVCAVCQMDRELKAMQL